MIRDEYLRLINSFHSAESDYFIKVDTEKRVPIYIGISKQKKPFFMFEISEDSILLAQQIKGTSGYSVCFMPSKDAVKEKRVKIEAMNNGSYEIFFSVIQDLISTVIESQRSDTTIIISRLFLWEDFFTHTSNGILSDTSETGLFGELLFIEEELSNGNQEIINCWKGPLKDAKDFVISSIAIEVKTSRVSATNRLKISDENQLDDSGFEKLFLNYRLISQNQMDGRSLPELYDDILSLMNHDSLIRDSFILKMMHAGYKDEFRGKYLNKYEQTDDYWFIVHDFEDKAFPRIQPKDLKAGVKFVKYQIELSNMGSFIIDRPILS